MKLGIMQPYLFPYVGYFQLMQAVDRFIIYDDVNFIKNGWINRNRLLLDGEPRYFSVPLAGASSNKKIFEVGIQPPASWRRKLVQHFTQVYARAAHRRAVLVLLERVLDTVDASASIADLARASITAVAKHLGLTSEIVPTSRIYGNETLSGQARVLDICQREGAAVYINASGGCGLYDPLAFNNNNVKLRFLSPMLKPYFQHNTSTFVPGLSILDLMANLSVEEVKNYIGMHEISE